MPTFPPPTRPGPRAELRIAIDGETLVLDGSPSRPDDTDGAPIVSYAWVTRPDSPAPLAAPSGGPLEGQRATAALPSADGEYYVTLRVQDAAGRADTASSYFVVQGRRARVPAYASENPGWVERAVVYGVIPRLFGAPAFQAIAARLDDLRDLGVNALWLAPVNRSPVGDFGYAVTDYVDVNPEYGSREDFRRLVQAAHARGIRVLMDFVPNHSSAQHPFFLDAQARGRESPYYDFYDRDEQGGPTHYFGWTHLPNLNYDNPAVRQYMLDAFTYWVREFDVDGFRVDVAWGIRERRPDFWPLWRRELQRIKPDLLLLAEASARDPYYFDNGFDAAYDWTAQLGKWAWEIVWESKTLLTYNLHAALTNAGRGFHPDALIFRFLNNNDTGTRFITDHGEELTRLAAALLLTLPGIPCVYTGDEIGAAYHPYRDAAPLAWQETYPRLRDHYRHLIRLRIETPSLHARAWQPLNAEPSRQVYAYLRFLPPAEAPLLVLLNFSGADLQAEVRLPPPFESFGRGRALTNLLTGAAVTPSMGASLTLALPAWSALVLS
ncbi:MAG TPA: alpha-amylase family glycosyl hydrolase [Roseiflexaceae bacterium]|nr:alpha-amylase family glycosyl hydrolase [Roseiflexaceae bacterium]